MRPSPTGTQLSEQAMRPPKSSPKLRRLTKAEARAAILTPYTASPTCPDRAYHHHAQRCPTCKGLA